MLAINYTTLRTNLKSYFDKAVDNDEDIIITRKNERNVVLLSLDKYNEFLKAMRNLEYMTKIRDGIAELEAGKGEIHDLIEVDDE